ncbi:hypothetical protein FRB98_003607, partial [Tulasnella sp. 332]
TPYFGYPEPVPGGTSIPTWAYLDPRANNSWNALAAEQNATGQSVTTSASSVLPSTPSIAPTVPSITPIASSSINAGSIVGPVVGGVVGGIAVLGLLGIGIFFYLRRRTAANNRGQQVITVQYGTEYTPSHRHTGTDEPSYGIDTRTSTFLRPSWQAYDPSDPIIYSATPAPTYMSHDRALSGDSQ